MASRNDNVYVELFDQLHIPERLEPENIKLLLDNYAASKVSAPEARMVASEPEKPAEKPAVRKHDFSDPEAFGGRQISLSSGERETEPAAETEQITPKITKTSNIRKTSTAFRSIASIAACAALAFGVAGYMGAFDEELPAEQPQYGGSFASDYDDLHKTFEKYYVDNGENKTLDSALADIEHSYNGGENDPNSSVVTQPAETEAPAPEIPPETTAPAQVPDNVEPPASEPAPQQPAEQPGEVEELPKPPVSAPNELPLPSQKAETEDNIRFGDGFMAEIENGSIKIYDISGRGITLTDTVTATMMPGENKELCDVFTDGTRLVAVYTVTGSYPQDAGVNGVLDGLYGTAGSQSSVEVAAYRIMGGVAVPETTMVQDGGLVDMNFINGSLYVVSAYNNYRNAPIIGVEDLGSYVPSYTLNGVKLYIEPQSIMIPDYISTTDYTVISGLSPDGRVSVQAALGYEGRVILKNGAVYLFGYDSYSDSDLTSVKVFSLANGEVVYAGYKDIRGVALGGDGITLFGNSIAITSVEADASGEYITNVAVYDGTMNLVSLVTLPGALTSVSRTGSLLALVGAKESYVVDLSDPSSPAVVTGSVPAKDTAEGLMEIDGGYVTLTQTPSGEIVLAKLSKDAAGALKLDYRTTVSPEGKSKAVENNGLLFVSGSTVGVPYGLFDGLDYCYRYALYNAGAAGFEKVGEIEYHEIDDVFEPGKAVLNNGSLYIFSEGRVVRTSTQGGLAVSGTANLIESAYSGH